jgi:hypothetical protein
MIFRRIENMSPVIKGSNPLLKTCAIRLTVFVLMPLNTILFSQDFSNGTVRFIFRPENNSTQFAVWMEDDSGKYIETIFLTNFMGRRGGGNRTGGTDIDAADGNRLSALPVWSRKRGVIDTTFGIRNYYPPAENRPAYPSDIDAVSGATPGPAVQTKTRPLSGLPYGEYRCRIEANRSFDTNRYHNYSYYRGQPSVVWEAVIRVTDSADSGMASDYLGYGSADGSDGKINPPDSTITTAANLLRDFGGCKFKVVYTPGQTGVEEGGSMPLSDPVFSLGQNCPNPFSARGGSAFGGNSGTEIRYFLPQNSRVHLTVYDILGRRVAVLIDGHEAAGNKRIRWDGRDSQGRDVPEGIYLYIIHAGGTTRMKRMIFLK